ncbi:MAG: hypothetical protein H0T45_07155 [Pyrinomonadaceae bacterium]|nr:hypothetical protein [Pyrinomonadaceae bacterium]MDQ3134348.1 hypothetical protein [Acidobacteriota bacterium]
MLFPTRLRLSSITVGSRFRPPTIVAAAAAGRRLCLGLLIAVVLLGAGGCSRFVKQQVTVPAQLSPLLDADTNQLLDEVNRLSQVRSLRGKIDVQFLDSSFARCGIAEKYRTAEGDVILQRPGQVYLTIQAPFVGTKIAEMASNGERFEVAVYQGDEKYRRFVKGTNKANYKRLEGAAAEADCDDNGKKKSAMAQQRQVGALSGLRPQHFTDALLVPPVAPSANGGNLLYAKSEAFVEEPDDRPGAKKGIRILRGYYVLDELAPEATGRARLLRRFWFDRFIAIRLARLQNFDERGQLTTDVIYKNAQRFGEGANYMLPASIELTRPQDRYSLRVTYQTPESVRVDQNWPTETFVLENKSNLQEVDLDKE